MGEVGANPFLAVLLSATALNVGVTVSRGWVDVTVSHVLHSARTRPKCRWDLARSVDAVSRNPAEPDLRGSPVRRESDPLRHLGVMPHLLIAPSKWDTMGTLRLNAVDVGRILRHDPATVG